MIIIKMEIIRKNICLENFICRSPFLLKIENFYIWDTNKYIPLSNGFDDIIYDEYYIRNGNSYNFVSEKKPEDSNDNNTIEKNYLPKEKIEGYFYVVYNNKYYTWRDGRYNFVSEKKPDTSNTQNTIIYNPFNTITDNENIKYVKIVGNVKKIEVLPNYKDNEYHYLLITKYNDKCWGNIIRKIDILDKKIDYKTFITIYNELFNIVINANYYEYDESGDKWLKVNYDWRNVFYDDMYNMQYLDNFPKENLRDRMIIGVVNSVQYDYFNQYINESIKKNKNGLDFLIESHKKIGKIITPPWFNGIYVPYYIYTIEIPNLIEELTKLRNERNKNCCKLINFEEYGGDDFLIFLNENKCIINDNNKEYENDVFLNIPLLLTSKLVDLGQYRVYDVDEIDEDTGDIINNRNVIDRSYTIVKTQGESKLKSLSRRKRSYDDDGNELPFIIDEIKNDNTIKYSDIYKIGYIKNINIIDNNMYGDGIYSITTNKDGEKEFTYVLGGLLHKNGKKIEIKEIPPFDLNEDEYSNWNGRGIWYRETYPIEKNKTEKYIIDGIEKTFTYDKIDFESKEITYTFDGIDFPRKNYILCNDIRYKSDSYVANCTSDEIFRDEKMMNLKLPLKEFYDVTITRGTSAAFERHLQLTELKTWEDLESYRNGMFIE